MKHCHIESCIDDVRSWCASKHLQLNASKTKKLWFGTAAQDITPIGGNAVEPESVVRDLGVYVNAEWTIQELDCQVTTQLVSMLILSILDYSNAILTGLPASTLAPLQCVLNAAARLVLELKYLDNISAAPQELHLLSTRKRIEYMLCLLAHNVWTGHRPEHITELLTAKSDGLSKALRTAATL